MFFSETCNMHWKQGRKQGVSTHYNLVSSLLSFSKIDCGHKSWIYKCFDFIRQGVNFHRVPDGADKGQPKLVFVFWSEKVSKSP